FGPGNVEGWLWFPGRQSLSDAHMDLAELIAAAFGRAVAQHAVRTRSAWRSELEADRERALKRFLSGGGIMEALYEVASLLDRYAPNCRGAVLTIDGWTVECVAAPGLPAEYHGATSPLRVLPPATNAAHAFPVHASMADGARHIEVAARLGFPYCESAPLLSRSGEMLGLLVAHCSQPPARTTREALRSVSRLAS